MNLPNLIRNVKNSVINDPNAIKSWWLRHSIDGKSDTFQIKDGLLFYDRLTLRLNCKELSHKIGFVKEIMFNSNLKSVRNFPDKPGSVNRISCSGAYIKKIDHPICCVSLNLERNKLTSLEGIHKFVTCESINVLNNPVCGPILGLLLIHGIKEIYHVGKAWQRSGYYHIDEYREYHQALEIVARYIGKGKLGILDAQQELLDNDLDDFAGV